MFATQVLSEDQPINISKVDDDDQIVGFIIVDNKSYDIRKGETKIGRDPSLCPIAIENFAISKVHAIIESEGIDDTFIYDVESTNQTKLGKKVLKPHCRYKLENDSEITLGNKPIKFILPPKIRNNTQSGSDLENFNSLFGLDNIFDIATQVSISDSLTPVKILRCEKKSENLEIFKVPNLLIPENYVEESPGSSKSSGATSNQSDLHDLKSKTEYCNSFIDSCGIFNVSTQCQITQPFIKENMSENKMSIDQTNNELDKINSLLNDGQDDMLCTFMSLNSPNELPKKIKTEVTDDNLSQLFDAQTQMPTTVIQSTSEKIVEQVSQFNEDVLSKSFQPSISTSPVNSGLKLKPKNNFFEKSNSDTDYAEEEFIKTQEFNVYPTVQPCVSLMVDTDNVFQESGSEHYLEKTLKPSVREGRTENDCTQTRDLQKTIDKVPKDDDSNESKEDIMSTQIYFNKKEQCNEKVETETAKKQNNGFSLVRETPEKGTDFYMEVSADSTERNMEDDLISTQVFNGKSEGQHADLSDDGSSERTNDLGDDDEDFIATQPVDFAINSTIKNKNFQVTSFNVQTISRVGSNDLLDSGASAKISEDFISTQAFEGFRSEECKTSLFELSKQRDSVLPISVKKELTDFNFRRVDETVESSGDETESDIEIILHKNEASEKTISIEECSNKSFKIESQQCEKSISVRSTGVHEDDDSNSSYIFQLDAEAPVEGKTAVTVTTLSTKENSMQGQEKLYIELDSDSTDCEEIAVVSPKIPVKQELPGKNTFEETQVLTLTLLDNFNQVSGPNDKGIFGKESPKLVAENDNECWSPLFLEMPNTENMETSINRILCKKTDTEIRDLEKEKEDYKTPSKLEMTDLGKEIFDSDITRERANRKVDSTFKRPGCDNSETEVVPNKRSKSENSDRKLRSSEKQFLKLWQAHDIEQIQPSRTRNSSKNLTTENKSRTDTHLANKITNEQQTARRKTHTKRKSSGKLNNDITSYFCQKMASRRLSLEAKKKEIFPREGKGKTESLESDVRALRSSRRSNGNVPSSSSFGSPAKNAPNTRSRRNSRLQSEDYFSNSSVKVVFTGFDCESFESIIINLGGTKANDLSTGDVVVADKVRRTVKFLCAIGLSLPITSPQWLVSCRTAKKFLNPWNFILKDTESEAKWDFELQTSLERSKQVKLMQGLSVFATKNAKPPAKDLLAIVECCGGTPLFNPPDVWPKKTVIASCLEDEKCWPLAKHKNIKIVHYECILSGVLRQKLDFKTYKLR